MSSIFLNNDVDNPYGSNRLVFFLRKPKPLEIATKNSRLTKDQLIRKMFVKTVDAYFVENAPAKKIQETIMSTELRRPTLFDHSPSSTPGHAL